MFNISRGNWSKVIYGNGKFCSISNNDYSDPTSYTLNNFIISKESRMRK